MFHKLENDNHTQRRLKLLALLLEKKIKKILDDDK